MHCLNTIYSHVPNVNVNAIYDAAYNYCNEIPKNTSKHMIYSFVIAGVMRTVCLNNLQEGLVAGILSATACAIAGLVTPLFKSVLGNDRQNLNINEEMLRQMVAVIITGAICQAFGNPSVINDLAFTAFKLFIKTYLGDISYSINSVNWFLPINSPTLV